MNSIDKINTVAGLNELIPLGLGIAGSNAAPPGLGVFAPESRPFQGAGERQPESCWQMQRPQPAAT